MAEEFVPKWIAWETTQRCNLKCVHCRCSSELTSSEGDFTTEEGKKLLKEIADLDDAFERGDVGDSEYQKKRLDKKRLLANLMQQRGRR